MRIVLLTYDHTAPSIHVAFTGPPEPVVEKVGWSDDTVRNFHIGGYKVCEKWLKDRKGRTLGADDLVHYPRIVIALHETIRLMKGIDEVIDAHGGWPRAFTADRQEPQ